MFVLIISRGFPSLQDVMIGNFEADQARALYALVHKVVVFMIDILVLIIELLME